MPLQWNGAAVIARLKAAEQAALQETVEACVIEAKHRVRVDTAALQKSIRVITPATTTTNSEGSSAEFGSNTVEYAIDQEIGEPGRKYGFTPYIRPSADIEAKQLAERIKKRM